jgi:uncharacterized protein (DUF1810 family)
MRGRPILGSDRPHTAYMSDDRQLSRFRLAQDTGGAYERAVMELRAGRKATHWMWYVFPQLEGLGHSVASRTYAIRSLAEARSYVGDPVLGARLVECAGIIAALHGLSAERIFGVIDAMKLRSSMTLFARAAPDQEVFPEVLAIYFDGVADTATEALLDEQNS